MRLKMMLGLVLLQVSMMHAALPLMNEQVGDEDAETRCIHGAQLAPYGVTCCTPKDGYFRNLFVTDTITTGSIIINGGGGGGSCPTVNVFVDVVVTNTVLGSGSSGCCLSQTGSGCDAVLSNLTVLQNMSAGYYDTLDRYEVLLSNDEIYDTFGYETLLTATDGLAGDQFGISVAISARGTYAVVGANGKNGGSGVVYVYRRDVNNTWNLLQEIPSPAAGAHFGVKVAVTADGSILAVGASSKAASGPNGTGAVYVYVRDSSSGLYTLYQVILNPDAGVVDSFGQALDISASGEYLMVGDPSYSTGLAGQGAAYIFLQGVSCSNCLGLVATTTTWALQQQLLEPTPGVNDHFGLSVKLSADGGYAAVGSPQTPPNAAGAAYVFKQNSNVWNTVTAFAPSDTLGGYAFGTSVSLAGNGLYLIVGAPNQAGTGLAYVFYRSSSVWNQQAIIAPHTANSSFGIAVAISNNGTKSVIGGVATSIGVIEAYDRFSSNWKYMQTIMASNGVAGNAFGGSLALSYDGSFLISGAAAVALGTGAAYIYQPQCSFVPSDLTISGSLCVQGNATINGNLLITGTLFYGGAAPTAQAVVPCGICPSDKHLKKNIKALDGETALLLLHKLHPVSFDWKRPELHPEMGDSPVGFITQEVQQVFPHWITERMPTDAEKELFDDGKLEQLLAIKPDMFALLVAGLQKLQRDYDELWLRAQQMQ